MHFKIVLRITCTLVKQIIRRDVNITVVIVISVLAFWNNILDAFIL